MAKNAIDTNCFLCGKPAARADTDAGNRKLYRCSNPDCGDYEISVTAMRRLENSVGHKEDLMQLVRSHSGTDKLVEIIVGLDNHVVAKPVPRQKAHNLSRTEL
jgi:hypothetical protein